MLLSLTPDSDGEFSRSSPVHRDVEGCRLGHWDELQVTQCQAHTGCVRHTAYEGTPTHRLTIELGKERVKSGVLGQINIGIWLESWSVYKILI